MFYIYIYIYVYIYIYIYIYLCQLCTPVQKKTYQFLKPVMFWFAQKPFIDCTSTDSVKNISELNQSKSTKEQFKTE